MVFFSYCFKSLRSKEEYANINNYLCDCGHVKLQTFYLSVREKANVVSFMVYTIQDPYNDQSIM